MRRRRRDIIVVVLFVVTLVATVCICVTDKHEYEDYISGPEQDEFTHEDPCVLDGNITLIGAERLSEETTSKCIEVLKVAMVQHSMFEEDYLFNLYSTVNAYTYVYECITFPIKIQVNIDDYSYEVLEE